MIKLDSLKLINSKTKEAYNLAAQKYHDFFHNELDKKEYDKNLLNNFSNRLRNDSLVLDAGCGPSGHISRLIYKKGINVVGIDISDKCIEFAKKYNPQMHFECQDMSNLQFEDCVFDGVISYYSIIDTPKKYMHLIFTEFRRVLKPNGYLLIAVKGGTTEGFVDDLLGFKVKLYFTLFSEKDIARYFNQTGFTLEFIEKRDPYDFEINNDRIFAFGRKL